MDKQKFSRRDFVRQGFKSLTSLASDLGFGASGQTGASAQSAVLSAMADYPGDGATLSAFIARPEKPGTYPAIIVIHEIFGLVDHIKDVATRFAREGYVAIAPHLFSREEPIPNRTDLQAMRQLIQTIPDGRILSDLNATIQHLSVLHFVNADRIGAIGFCMGGLYAFLLAAQTTRLRAIADFYGRVVYPERTPLKPEAPLDAVERVNCPVLGIFGDADPVIPVADVDRLREGLQRHQKPFEIKVYPNAPHAFFNDTRESYRPDMAKDAWERTLSFFWKYLRG
ncbi:MAG: dienelactone hydrolase family protein [Candidatus Latescibacteria bacterium]|nr:dienelactone hydrolase family protein [Candidatus Latescibacterota bacterium]